MEHDNIIKEFCLITGVNNEIALGALECSNWDLGVAVQVFMDGSSDEMVRQPMPQKYDKLVDENPHPRPLYRRHINNVAVNPFNGIRVGSLPSSSRKRSLDTLFNPPTDITCKMSFEMAKKQASSSNHFLLVDIQKASEFECCVLNRDVWSDFHIRNLLQLHFVLWQVRSDSEDGVKFIQYYKAHLWPYVAILDPRTGENLLTINSCKLDDVTQSIESFLGMHKSFLSPSGQPPSKKRKQDELSIIDLSEEDQLSSAIQQSLKQNGSHNGKLHNQHGHVFEYEGEDDDNGETDSEVYEVDEATNNFHHEKGSLKSLASRCIAQSESISSIMEKHSLDDSQLTSTSTNETICRVLIRLSDGARHNLNMPSNTKLKVLFAFVSSVMPRSHQLLLMFPKRTISFNDGDKTFFDAGLYPSNNVYVEDMEDS